MFLTSKTCKHISYHQILRAQSKDPQCVAWWDVKVFLLFYHATSIVFLY